MIEINNHTAIVDNDFTNHLAECHLTDEQLVTTLNIMFSELNLAAVMHPLVYDKELLADKARVKLLFEKKVFAKAEFSDIFQGCSAKKLYYIQMVRNLYHVLTGENFPFNGEDVLTQWIRQKSFGEVHSFATCLLCGCGIFLSDDGDSKRIKQNLDRATASKVEVYSRQEFMDKFRAEGETKFNRRDRQALTHSSST